jgi:uncharacterized membrane protein
MPDIAALHPQVVHFVVVCLFVGLPLYLLGFMKRPKFLRPAATLLLVIGALATIPSVKSGDDAHGPAERIPGVRDAVVRHEDLGERTRTIFLGVLALELIALGLAWRLGGSKGPMAMAPTAMRVAVSVTWLVGAFVLYETAEHGGEIVYEHAGGVGFRSGDDGDVANLLLAGLYHQSVLDREAGDAAGAARLVEEMARRFPDNPGVQLAYVQSMITDAGNPRGAIETLDGMVLPDDRNSRFRSGLARVDAYEALELPDSARAVLEGMREEFNTSTTWQRRMEALGG